MESGKQKSLDNNTKCPLEDTGKNSVSPCTKPKINKYRMSTTTLKITVLTLGTKYDLKSILQGIFCRKDSLFKIKSQFLSNQKILQKKEL